MEKTTIAFIIHALGSGGAERVVSTLANELADKYRVVIITYQKRKPFYPLSSGITLFHCEEELPVSQNFFQSIQINYRLVIKISRFLRQENVKLSIGFMTSANILAILASRLSNIPVIISERNNPYLAKVPLFWKYMRRITYSKANFLIVQTAEVRKYFSEFLKSEKIVIINNPIAPDLTAGKNGQSVKENIVLNVGRFISGKAQDQLIKAFGAIKHKGWKLHLIGSGPKAEDYKQLINSLNLQDRVEMIPPTQNIELHYNTARIFAFTSLSEGYPNALIEAMHFGLACISTDCPTGPSEIMVNNSNGFLIPMNDQVALQEHLQLLIDDATLRSRLGEQAEKSVERFETKTIVKEWQNLIENSFH